MSGVVERGFTMPSQERPATTAAAVPEPGFPLSDAS
jgi:hypothetical protein